MAPTNMPATSSAFASTRPKRFHSFSTTSTKSESWLEWIRSNSETGTLKNINAGLYSSFQVPLPPLDVQKEIEAEIESYQRVIDVARAVIDNYRPKIPISPNGHWWH